MHIENQLGTKHVEGIVIACLDEGSNPSGSTTLKNTQQTKGMKKCQAGLSIFEHFRMPIVITMGIFICNIARIRDM